eukprot:scaffold2774_cov137-Isochrysis_galbana.AAC.9
MLPVHDAQRRNVIRKYGLWHESSRLKGLARQVHLQRSSVRREFGVVGGVLVRVERLVLAEEDVPRGHHLEVVFQRRRLAVHHKAVLAQLRLAHAPAGAQPIPVPSRHPAPVAHRVGHQQPLGAVLAGRDEEERVDVVRHIHQQRVEGVHAGLSRYAKRAGDARDRHLARDAAPLARDVRQVSLRVPTELMPAAGEKAYCCGLWRCLNASGRTSGREQSSARAMRCRRSGQKSWDDAAPH